MTVERSGSVPKTFVRTGVDKMISPDLQDTMMKNLEVDSMFELAPDAHGDPAAKECPRNGGIPPGPLADQEQPIEIVACSPTDSRHLDRGLFPQFDDRQRIPILVHSVAQIDTGKYQLTARDLEKDRAPGTQMEGLGSFRIHVHCEEISIRNELNQTIEHIVRQALTAPDHEPVDLHQRKVASQRNNLLQGSIDTRIGPQTTKVLEE